MPGKTVNSLDIDKDPRDTRVVVAMSGGVDSSVVAGLLAREGYDVLGVTLQLYDHGAAVHRAGACCAGQDIDDARRVCETLGIPHYVLDYEKRFREAVINPFAESYVAGETPIPCVPATRRSSSPICWPPRGIWARMRWRPGTISARAPTRRRAIPAGGRSTGRSIRSGTRAISCSPPPRTSSIMCAFRSANCPKIRTRELAEEMGLIVADKADSQDICFVPQGKYANVITKLKPNAALAGDIVHIDGRVLGEHPGIVHYTIGQRKGLGVATGDPLYVVHLDARSRRVIVGPREALDTRRLILRDVNWLGDMPLAEIGPEGLSCFAKVRSTRPPRPAIVRLGGNGEVSVELVEGEAGVAPGQACVLYSGPGDEARVFGGGFIDHSERSPAAEAMLSSLLQPAA
jgi:tRNA-specific 2-thiouridylase